MAFARKENMKTTVRDLVQFVDSPTEAKLLLDGSAMPRVIQEFSAAIVGAKITAAGYLILHGTAVPALRLDNGEWITAQCDDEDNGPGVLALESGPILCQTSPRNPPSHWKVFKP